MIQDSFSSSINWELKKKNTAIVYVKIKYVFILITVWKGLKKRNLQCPERLGG